jgi:hypothetical protein
VIEEKLEGRIEMTGRRGRRRKQLLDDLKEKRRYCKFKEEALDRTCGELALEEAMDLSYDRLQNEYIMLVQYPKFTIKSFDGWIMAVIK